MHPAGTAYFAPHYAEDASGEGYADKMQAVLDDMARLQDDADRLEAYAIDAKVDKVVDTMGFVPEEADAKVRSFSGGWKMRIGLGKILLQDPNILLLDEPTNHLDVINVKWVLDYLKALKGVTSIIVSHDSKLLDEVTSLNSFNCSSFSAPISAVTTSGTAALSSSGDMSFRLIWFTVPVNSASMRRALAKESLLVMSYTIAAALAPL